MLTPGEAQMHLNLRPSLGTRGKPASAPVPVNDDYFANVVLLVDFNGDAVDDSLAAHTLTPSGDPSIDATDSPSFQSQSVDLDGTGDYYTVAHSADWDFGSGDFTIEGWCRSGDTVTDALITQFGANDKAWALFDDGDGSIEFYWSTNGSANSGPLSYAHGDKVNTWVHVAVSRVGNTLYLAYDGVIRATADVTGVTIFNSGRDLVFGANNAGISAVYTGRLAEWRITKGTGRYSGSVNDPISVQPPFPRS